MVPQLAVDGRVPLAEAAAEFGVTSKTFSRWISEGRIKAERVGPRRIYVRRADLDALGEEVNATPPDPIREAAVRVVSEAPRLGAEQLEQICALLRGVA